MADRTQELIDGSSATAPPIEALSVRIPSALKTRFTEACKALGIDRNKAAAGALDDAASRYEAEIKARAAAAKKTP